MSIGTTIKGLHTVKHPTIEDAYGISVEFECEGCGKKYSIEEFDKRNGEDFLKSLSNGKPNRNVLCTKCNTHIN